MIVTLKVTEEFAKQNNLMVIGHVVHADRIVKNVLSGGEQILNIHLSPNQNNLNLLEQTFQKGRSSAEIDWAQWDLIRVEDRCLERFEVQ